jgi:hypothetical protein
VAKRGKGQQGKKESTNNLKNGDSYPHRAQYLRGFRAKSASMAKSSFL